MTEYERDVAKLGEIAKHEAERIKALEDENAKLRKVLTAFANIARHGCIDCSASTYTCPHFKDCWKKPITFKCKLVELSRELGIEVSE